MGVFDSVAKFTWATLTSLFGVRMGDALNTVSVICFKASAVVVRGRLDGLALSLVLSKGCLLDDGKLLLLSSSRSPSRCLTGSLLVDTVPLGQSASGYCLGRCAFKSFLVC